MAIKECARRMGPQVPLPSTGDGSECSTEDIAGSEGSSPISNLYYNSEGGASAAAGKEYPEAAPQPTLRPPPRPHAQMRPRRKKAPGQMIPAPPGLPGQGMAAPRGYPKTSQKAAARSLPHSSGTASQPFPGAPYMWNYSRGSKNHFLGQCRPCLASNTPDGCARGFTCNFCHYTHPEELVIEASLHSVNARLRRLEVEGSAPPAEHQRSRHQQTPTVAHEVKGGAPPAEYQRSQHQQTPAAAHEVEGGAPPAEYQRSTYQQTPAAAHEVAPVTRPYELYEPFHQCADLGKPWYVSGSLAMPLGCVIVDSFSV